MSKKRAFIRSKVDRHIKVSRIIIHIMMTIMIAEVFYDSFVHELPFYYILSFLFGILIGRLFYVTQELKVKEEDSRLTLKKNYWGILLMLLLLTWKFFVGKEVLESFNVTWVKDALYLFSIGVSHSKLRVLILKIDEFYYSTLSEKYE